MSVAARDGAAPPGTTPMGQGHSPGLLLRAAQRALTAGSPRGIVSGSRAALEFGRDNSDRPVTNRARPVEEPVVRAHVVSGPPATPFAAFLDGTQRSIRVGHDGIAPLVLGTTAAVVRTRHAARMHTWEDGHIRREKLYVPKAMVAVGVLDRLAAHDGDLVDTLRGVDPAAIEQHPLALERLAYDAVLRDREQIERRLGEAWCTRGDGALFVDGSLVGETLARAVNAVGVIKSHFTLHVAGDDLLTVLALRAGERSTVLEVSARESRPAVATWYLRLRDPAGHDPLWGLVRVEAAMDPVGDATPGARADEWSSMVLAEVRPLALPDGRWDKMAYPIRDCEEFLRATL